MTAEGATRPPGLDPQLPRALLPANWTGSKAAELFHRKHEEGKAAAAECWDEMSLGRCS